jgi:FAD/FMN-containing dehydrogenase
MAAQAERDAARLVTAMQPWVNGREYLNFAESAVDPARGYRAADYARLAAIRAAVDPEGRFVANHAVARTAVQAFVPAQR